MCASVCLCVSVCVSVWVSVCACVCECACVYLCVRVCVRVCMVRLLKLDFEDFEKIHGVAQFSSFTQNFQVPEGSQVSTIFYTEQYA